MRKNFELIRMKNKYWTIVGILFFISVRPPVSIQATYPNGKFFSPTAQGEFWEHDFLLKGLERYTLNFQMCAFAKYNISVKLDPIKSGDSPPFSVLCSINPPLNYSLNNNPSILSSRLEKFHLGDGEELSYLATSYIHLGEASISLTFDTWNTSYYIPTEGVSGQVKIHVLNLGLQDNSLYRTEFRLNSNQSSFEFVFEKIIMLDNATASYGEEAELKAVVSSVANSTGKVCLNLSESYHKTDDDGSYPQNYSTLQAMIVSPGVNKEQIFIQDNDGFDSYITVPFILSLTNTSTSAYGNLSIHLHKLGKQKPDTINASMIDIYLGLICLVVFFRNRGKKSPF
jgi:hypothetical protein